MTALSNNPSKGVAPSNLLPCSNVVKRMRDGYEFVYQGDDCRVVYTYKPTTGALDDFAAQVDNGAIFQPACGGGATANWVREGKTENVFLRGGRPITSSNDDHSLHVLWEYDTPGQPLRIAWEFGLAGKSLLVSARCDHPSVSQFSLGEVGPVPLRLTFSIPYMGTAPPGQVVYLHGQNVFVCRYLDWTVSHASQCPRGVATYEPKTDGHRNTLTESGYVAVSPNINEVLPNIPHPPSSHLATLGSRIILDIWQHRGGTYQGDAENLRTLKDHGVDHLAVIQHNWQRYGYDVKLPDHLPANPAFGGDDGMIAFGKIAKECGYLWALHENYTDIYPDAPSYDPKLRVFLMDGSPSKGWYNTATQAQAFGLKCSRAIEFAKRNAPEAHRRYGTTSAYLDVNTCVPPWFQLDHEAGQPMAAMAMARVKFDTELFSFLRNAHGGPLLGEGANHFYWAGRCDGVEAQIQGGEDHSPFLDFDLLKIHPQMVNHGMGYYERWYRKGYKLRWGIDAGAMEQIDKYRAQEMAYGHAGFVSAGQVNNIPWVIREHHLVHPVQCLYATSKPVEIRYEVNGQMVDAGVALVAGNTTRQRIRYDSGLTLWVNWRPESWQVNGHTLPQWGFLALGPGAQVWTALRDGHYADYAECPEYVFADARTCFPMPYRNEQHPKAPNEPDFTARLNPPGTWLDFGLVATDGSVKINREANQLVLFPYPREKAFRVTLDVKAMAPTADMSAIKIHLLAAQTCQNVGTIKTQFENGRLTLTLGKPGVGRYVISWK